MESSSSSNTSLPLRTLNQGTASLFAANSTPTSRSASPNGQSRTGLSSIFATTSNISTQTVSTQSDSPRNLMLQAFVPHIAVHTSEDTNDLAKEKGFEQGLWQLLRPYGERVQGKVTIRDSVGSSRTCEDFGIRFVELEDVSYNKTNANNTRRSNEGTALHSNNTLGSDIEESPRVGGNVGLVEAVAEKRLAHAERFVNAAREDNFDYKGDDSGVDAQSPFYTLYVKRLLCGIPMAPHETFSHPVACIIAISSRNSSPIETLRRLYEESTRGEKRLPLWVNGDYLRYYVLVHDEEKDDISKSTTLFEQMKRHFGLHCHLLRIRSSHCIITDDDAIPFPKCDWIFAQEELDEIESREMQDDGEEPLLCLYDSDAASLRTFIREMVTQSVVPSMERCISTWNDQVASRRRGISGRFMNLSKKWTGFGSRATSSTNTAAGTGTNYDSSLGLYRPDTPEALLRKLADFAFMLRDWKLAQSTYEFCRSDYNNDKAWMYHAAANEMAAVSSLLLSQSLNTKIRMETIDQMLETATYSYVTRCSTPYGALRCLVLSMELLKMRGGSATDEAARWGARILEPRIVGSIGEALIKERIATCHAARKGTGSGLWGSRTRKAAFWKILAAECWLNQGKRSQAEIRLHEAENLYAELPHADSLSHFQEAYDFLADVKRKATSTNPGRLSLNSQLPSMDAKVANIEEESESLDSRSRRRSLTAPAVPLTSLVTAPLASTMEEDRRQRDDNFV